MSLSGFSIFFVCTHVAMASRAFTGAPRLQAARVAPVQRAAVRAHAAAADGLTLKIKLKAYEVPVLEEAVQVIRTAVGDTGASLSGTVPLPTRRRIYCVLRSPHVNSNSREHFEIRTHQRLIHVRDLTQDAVKSLMNIKLPAGVDCNVRL
jgi:small subunit ribosomal protein S10